MMIDKDVKPTSIRLTKETEEYIKVKAKYNHRSISAEIVALIEKDIYQMKKDS